MVLYDYTSSDYAYTRCQTTRALCCCSTYILPTIYYTSVYNILATPTTALYNSTALPVTTEPAFSFCTFLTSYYHFLSFCSPPIFFFFFFLMIRPPPRSPLFPSTTLFR